MRRTLKGISSPILIFLGALAVAGCQETSDKSEWSGTVSAELSDLGGGSFFMASVLTVSQDDRYILLFDPDLMTVGVTDNGGSIVWELGKHYRIRGELVRDRQELEVAERLGFSQIIRATYIELLPGVNQELIVEQVERYSATRVKSVAP
jgi:hypothetical protein